MDFSDGSISSQEVDVLLVDDDRSITSLGEDILERESSRFRCRTESDGLKALEIIQDEGLGVDAVVSDFEMPGMDGLELLEQVRNGGRDLPFFIYTAKGSEDIAAKAVENDVDGYMRKSGSPLTDWKLMGNKILQEVDENRISDIREAMLTYSNDIITVISTDGEIIYTSPASANILGYDEEEQLGESIMDYIHPEEREEIGQKMEMMREMESGESIRTKVRYRDSEGEYRLLESVGSYQPEKFDGIIVNSRVIDEE